MFVFLGVQGVSGLKFKRECLCHVLELVFVLLGAQADIGFEYEESGYIMFSD